MPAIYKMEMRSSLHLGTKEMVLEESSEYIHSDTLFSAISNAFRTLYGNDALEEMLNQFKTEPPFLISSAFPYIDDMLLFPIPKIVNLGKYTKDPGFKKVEFISGHIFDKIISGIDISEHINGNNLVQNGKVLLTGGEAFRCSELLDGKGRIYSKKERVRVALDRKTSQSNIYHFGEIVYSDKCGLYFLIDFKKDNYEKKIDATINFLGDEGIGGDRTYGKGLFIIKKENFKSFNEKGEFFVTLSLYYPRQDEIHYVSKGWYELISRGGWIYSLNAQDIRRRTVRMLNEGSVFKASPSLYGELINVKPTEFKDHNVYRYGYAFPIRMSEGVG